MKTCTIVEATDDKQQVYVQRFFTEKRLLSFCVVCSSTNLISSIYPIQDHEHEMHLILNA